MPNRTIHPRRAASGHGFGAAARPRVREVRRPDDTVGPLLFCRAWREGRLYLAALIARPEHLPDPQLQAAERSVAPELLYRRGRYRVLRYEFALPGVAQAGYRLDGDWYPVNAAWDGDLRIAYLSCNGQEAEDRERRVDERNRMWRRLAHQHAQTPLQMLLHGGDQLYADELLDQHPALRRWARHSIRVDGAELDPRLPEQLADYLFERYLEIYSQAPIRRLMSTVPSLAIWDDHDICDGWGSRPVEQLDSPVGRLVFETARELYLLFQMGARPDALPEPCVDREGGTLSWSVRLPKLRVVAPDLRSERRPDRVMGERGWSALEAMLADVSDEQVLLLSSVPVLGPRLSWVEALLGWIPHAQKYEDDLRDQWQSQAHRAEWRAVLEILLAAHRRPSVRLTVLSGEIHLATRGTLSCPGGDLHQLVSSGIAHPPPPVPYARLLGALARFGDSPLPHHPIRLWPLPGRRAIYAAQRNYLILEREAGRWRAHWELEDDGRTRSLPLG